LISQVPTQGPHRERPAARVHDERIAAADLGDAPVIASAAAPADAALASVQPPMAVSRPAMAGSTLTVRAGSRRRLRAGAGRIA
jgi:hypothetical protein